MMESTGVVVAAALGQWKKKQNKHIPVQHQDGNQIARVFVSKFLSRAGPSHDSMGAGNTEAPPPW